LHGTTNPMHCDIQDNEGLVDILKMWYYRFPTKNATV